MTKDERLVDAIDHKSYLLEEGIFLSDLDKRLQKLLLQHHPQLTEQSFISHKNLAQFRLMFLQEIVKKANKKNDYVRETVYEVSKNQDYMPLDLQEEWDSKITFGQRIADDVARFGGSWTFIICFVALMVLWMAFNIIKPFGWAFDAYPFILLNLALSTLAAIQAPLIMMSQNRASDYDRLQAKNDYNVNKKSEEGVRLLHAKLDHLVHQDQSDLLEIQKLQAEMLVSVTKQLATVEEQNQALIEKIEQLEQRSSENV